MTGGGEEIITVSCYVSDLVPLQNVMGFVLAYAVHLHQILQKSDWLFYVMLLSEGHTYRQTAYDI